MHEHQDAASSWEMQEVWKLMSEAGVHFVEIDQCETGTVLPSRRDDGKEEPIRSHSGFLTNSEEIAESLGVFRFRNWDEDDPTLLTSILEGLIKQMETDAKRGEGEWKICAMDIGVHVDEDAVDFDKPPAELAVYCDKISGAMLDPAKMKSATRGGGLRP